MQKTNWIIVACLLGFIGVALGAFGAHGLKETLAEGKRAEWWSTAVDYHMWHVMGILFAGLLHERRGRGAGAALAFSVGILIFSGIVSKRNHKTFLVLRGLRSQLIQFCLLMPVNTQLSRSPDVLVRGFLP